MKRRFIKVKKEKMRLIQQRVNEVNKEIDTFKTLTTPTIISVFTGAYFLILQLLDKFYKTTVIEDFNSKILKVIQNYDPEYTINSLTGDTKRIYDYYLSELESYSIIIILVFILFGLLGTVFLKWYYNNVMEKYSKKIESIKSTVNSTCKNQGHEFGDANQIKKSHKRVIEWLFLRKVLKHIKLDLSIVIKAIAIISVFVYFDYQNDQELTFKYFWPMMVSIILFQNFSNLIKLNNYRKAKVNSDYLWSKCYGIKVCKKAKVLSDSISHREYWFIEILPFMITFFGNIIIVFGLVLINTLGVGYLKKGFVDSFSELLAWGWFIFSVNAIIFIVEIVSNYVNMKLNHNIIVNFPLKFDELGKYVKVQYKPYRNDHKNLVAFQMEYENYTVEELEYELIILKSSMHNKVLSFLVKVLLPIINIIISIVASVAIAYVNSLDKIEDVKAFFNTLNSYIYIVIATIVILAFFITRGDVQKETHQKIEIIERFLLNVSNKP